MTQSIYSRLWTLSGVINVNIRRGKAINASQPFSVLSIPTLDLYAGTLSFDDTVKPFPVMSTPLAKCPVLQCFVAGANPRTNNPPCSNGVSVTRPSPVRSCLVKRQVCNFRCHYALQRRCRPNSITARNILTQRYTSRQ